MYMVNMEKFMTWLNEEIRIREYANNSLNLFRSGELSALIRVRQQICNMDKVIDTDLEDIAGQICDHYCVYPQAYGDREDDNQRMIEERCNNCPLNKLVG